MNPCPKCSNTLPHEHTHPVMFDRDGRQTDDPGKAFAVVVDSDLRFVEDAASKEWLYGLLRQWGWCFYPGPE